MGYHITFAQLAHAIDDLDQHHPATYNEGQVLLVVAPELNRKPHKALSRARALSRLPTRFGQTGVLMARQAWTGRQPHGIRPPPPR